MKFAEYEPLLYTFIGIIIGRYAGRFFSRLKSIFEGSKNERDNGRSVEGN
jgi:hypothetical protein